MKKKFLSVVLSITMLATVFGTGMFTLPVSAEDELYKTENVTVPDGWDYVEVHTVSELEETDDRHKMWNTSDTQPLYVRLMEDIEVSSVHADRYATALITLGYSTSTILDLNGHKIKGTISAQKNGDNCTWCTLNISLSYGLRPDYYFRIVDSVGGGGVTLNAYTDIDGPTNALLIQGHSLYLPGVYNRTEEQAPYYKDKVKVYIDGGSYNVYTKNDKFTAVQSGPLRDSNGIPRWERAYGATYTRSAVGLYDCLATVNNGHFTARCNTDGSVAGNMGRRFLSDLGLADATAVQNLKINGGVFDGDAYSVLWYHLTEYDYGISLPTLNGGTYTGGIQLCTTNSAFWKKVGGASYNLNSKMKDKKVSGLLIPGAVMTMDGKVINPDEKDLEDIAWPHEIKITGGPQILKERLLSSTLLLNHGTGYNIQFNQEPDSVELYEYISTIRLGQQYYIWQKAEDTFYTLQSKLGSNYYNVRIPARNTAETATFKVIATFGENRVSTDEFDVSWVDTNDFGFTYGPEISVGDGSRVAQVEFNCSHPEQLSEFSLWWLKKGEYWQKIENIDYSTPNYTPTNNYRIFIPELADKNSDETTYYIKLEYDVGAEEPFNCYSDEFTLSKDDVGELPNPYGVELSPTECTFTPDDHEETIKVTLFPIAEPHKTDYTVESSDESVVKVVSVEDGQFSISAIDDGTATITVTAAGGAQATCEVTAYGFNPDKTVIESADFIVTKPNADDLIPYEISVPDGSEYKVSDYENTYYKDGVAWKCQDEFLVPDENLTFIEGETYTIFISFTTADSSAYTFTDFDDFVATVNGNAGELHEQYFNQYIVSYTFEPTANDTESDTDSETTGSEDTETDSETTGDEDFLKGDINGDGIVDIIDVVLARAHIVGNTVLSAEQLKRGDMNGDNTLDIIDVVIMRNNIINQSK